MSRQQSRKGLHRTRTLMRRLRNIVYVTSEGAWLREEGANLVVEVEGAERGRVQPPSRRPTSTACAASKARRRLPTSPCFLR